MCGHKKTEDSRWIKRSRERLSQLISSQYMYSIKKEK